MFGIDRNVSSLGKAIEAIDGDPSQTSAGIPPYGNGG